MVVKEKEELVFFGPGMSTQEMDVEFKKLYDSLITYKVNILPGGHRLQRLRYGGSPSHEHRGAGQRPAAEAGGQGV